MHVLHKVYSSRTKYCANRRTTDNQLRCNLDCKIVLAITIHFKHRITTRGNHTIFKKMHLLLSIDYITKWSIEWHKQAWLQLRWDKQAGHRTRQRRHTRQLWIMQRTTRSKWVITWTKTTIDFHWDSSVRNLHYKLSSYMAVGCNYDIIYSYWILIKLN